MELLPGDKQLLCPRAHGRPGREDGGWLEVVEVILSKTTPSLAI